MSAWTSVPQFIVHVNKYQQTIGKKVKKEKHLKYSILNRSLAFIWSNEYVYKIPFSLCHANNKLYEQSIKRRNIQATHSNLLQIMIISANEYVLDARACE